MVLLREEATSSSLLEDSPSEVLGTTKQYYVDWHMSWSIR